MTAMTNHFHITLRKILLLGKCSSISFPHSGKTQCHWWLVIVDEGHYKAICIHQSVDRMDSRDLGCTDTHQVRLQFNIYWWETNHVLLIRSSEHLCALLLCHFFPLNNWYTYTAWRDWLIFSINSLHTLWLCIILHLPILSLFGYHYYM